MRSAESTAHQSQRLTVHMQDGRRPHPPRQRHGASSRRAGAGLVQIFGVHAVEAALNNPRREIRRLYLTDNAEHRLGTALATRQIAHERVLPKDLDRRLGPDTVHQGALAEAAPLPEPPLAELADGAAGRPLLVLDHVTDPHNVGAILRSAAVFGSGGLVMTRRHSPPLDGALAKAASGALEHVPVALVQNLARALTELKEHHFTIIGLDATATAGLEDTSWPEHVALVLGAEGRGLRQLTRESCDLLARIAGEGRITSLNVSNAAAVALHWAAARRLGLLGEGR
jgi:23S rRNA (guanosine2251-2'-O)-methyltransferase